MKLLHVILRVMMTGITMEYSPIKLKVSNGMLHFRHQFCFLVFLYFSVDNALDMAGIGDIVEKSFVIEFYQGAFALFMHCCGMRVAFE